MPTIILFITSGLRNQYMTEQEIIAQRIRTTLNLLSLSIGVDERSFNAALSRLHYQIRQLVAITDRDALAIMSEDQ